jgi:predicted MFS family arabinose efflux permease
MLGRLVRNYKEAYSGLPGPVWMLAVVEFVNRVGMMVLFFMTLYLTRRLNFSLTQAGQVISSYGIGSLIGTYLGGRLCDRIGAYHVQRLSLGFGGLFLILLAYPSSPLALMGLMFAFGAAAEALHPANLTAVAQVCPPEIRTRGFSLNRLAANLGLSIGPVVGGYLALVDYHLLFWVDGLTSWAALALFFFFFSTQAGPATAQVAVNQRHRKSPGQDPALLTLLGLIFLIALVFSQLFSTFPLYLREAYGFQENSIGKLIAVNTLLIVLTEMLIIHALQTHDPAKVARLGALALCTGFALLPLGSGFLYAAFTVAVWTAGEILTLPLLVTLVAGRAEPAAQGRYQGLLSLAFASALIAGPAFGSWVYKAFGGDIVWYGCGGLGVVIFSGFSVLIWQMNRERAITDHQP